MAVLYGRQGLRFNAVCPGPVGTSLVRAFIKEESNWETRRPYMPMSLGTGLGLIQDRVFRIGHLGDFGDLQLMGTLSGVEMGLRVAGVPHRSGGAQAAMDYLAGNA